MSVPVLRDDRAKEILTQYCNPKHFKDDDEMLAALSNAFPKEILVSLRGFLGNLIDNDAVVAPEKVKTYFNLSISDEEKAETFLDELYCTISEHLFPDEDE